MSSVYRRVVDTNGTAVEDLDATSRVELAGAAYWDDAHW